MVDSCYECVEITINDTISNPEFQYTTVDSERVEKLKSLCELIDQISEEFEVVSYEATANSEDPCIEISIECSEIIVDRMGHPFYEAMKFCRSVDFSRCKDDEDSLVVNFVFPDLFK